MIAPSSDEGRLGCVFRRRVSVGVVSVVVSTAGVADVIASRVEAFRFARRRSRLAAVRSAFLMFGVWAVAIVVEEVTVGVSLCRGVGMTHGVAVSMRRCVATREAVWCGGLRPGVFGACGFRVTFGHGAGEGGADCSALSGGGTFFNGAGVVGSGFLGGGLLVDRGDGGGSGSDSTDRGG